MPAEPRPTPAAVYLLADNLDAALAAGEDLLKSSLTWHAGNARSATTDLDALRGEVETSLRKIDSLINEVNRKWPFARDTEIKLP